MNKTLKISLFFIFSIAIWFAISDNLFNKQYLVFTHFDYQQHSTKSDTHQNSFNFDEEENCFDKQLNTLSHITFNNILIKEFYIFTEPRLSTFKLVIWQPPKIS